MIHADEKAPFPADDTKKVSNFSKTRLTLSLWQAL